MPEVNLIPNRMINKYPENVFIDISCFNSILN